MNGSQRVIVFMWLAAIGLIAVSGEKGSSTPFPPAFRFFGAAVVYSFLFAVALIPGGVGRLMAVFAAGWTIGLAYKLQLGIGPAGLLPPASSAGRSTAKAKAPTTSTKVTATNGGAQ